MFNSMLKLREILVNVLSIESWLTFTRKAESKTLETLTTDAIQRSGACSREEHNELRVHALEQSLTFLYSVKRPDEILYIKVVHIDGDRVKLSFKTPDDYVVMRGNAKDIAPESQLGEIIQGKINNVELLHQIKQRAIMCLGRRIDNGAEGYLREIIDLIPDNEQLGYSHARNARSNPEPTA